MHMTVSLVIECDGTIANGDDGANALEKHLASLCLTQRLAGALSPTFAELKSLIILKPRSPHADYCAAYCQVLRYWIALNCWLNILTG